MMQKDFIHRSFKVSIVVALLFAPFLLVYFGPSIALGFMAGAVWNIVNIFLLYWVLTMTLSATPSNKMWGATAGILKFPVLYGTGYLIIRYTNLSLYGIIAGFSLILIVFVLRASGIYLKNHAANCEVLRSVKKIGFRNYGRGA